MGKHARLPASDAAPETAAAAVHRIHRPQTRYYAFLSYSHKDQAMADWLHRELERFRVPRSLAGHLTDNGVIPKRLKPIFRDRHELAAADDLGEEIREALASSRFLIVLCSPDAAKSRWTNAEIEAFKRSHPEGFVLAAVVAGEPFASDIPGRESEESFPPALTQKYDRRGRPTGKRAEPLAADLREAGDGRRIGFLKLVAGMLGVGLDELVRRETTYRHRRLAWLAAASLGGMAVTSTLAITAIQARDAARDQRREAEGLVAFMLGDLKDKLEPIGRLAALDGVGQRVLAYYSKQDASELSDAGLLQRSQALSLTAQVAYQRMDLETAQQLYRQAMQGTAEAIRRNPDDPQRLYDHAQNVFWIGDIARDLGRSDQAEAAYREYKRLADRMMSLEPDNLRWRMEGLYARLNIGIVLRNQRRFAEAARQFSETLGPMQALASIDPKNSEYQQHTSAFLAWSADAESDLGQLDSAIRLRERQISFLRRLLAGGEPNAALRSELIPAHQGLAILYVSTGQSERGIDQLRRALAEADRLLPIEPDNLFWKGLATQARLELAKTLLSLGRSAEADKEARAGCRLAAQVHDRDQGASWRHLQTNCLTLRSRLELELGGAADASRLAELALASARAERSEDSTRVRYRVAAILRHIGDIRRRMGDTGGAMVAWAAALAELPTNVPERPWEMHERAEILSRLGRADDARPIVQRLEAIGYQRTI